MLRLWFIVFLFSITLPAFAQKKKGVDSTEALMSDSIPELEIKFDEEELNLADQADSQRKNKNSKKKYKKYFGIKTKRGFARKDDETLELFRLIGSNYLMKNSYQRDIYYYDTKNNRIKNDNYNDLSAKIKKGLIVFLLHGPYQRLRNGEVRERGFFYKGDKHGKWEEFDGNGILLEKAKWELGWPAESKITYYDQQKTKIKEIIPMVHGRMQGKYYQFYENGVIAVEGTYDNNCKVSLWREYYENRQRKMDTQCPTRWYDKKEAYKLREWDKQGKMIYDIDRGGKLKS